MTCLMKKGNGEWKAKITRRKFPRGHEWQFSLIYDHFVCISLKLSHQMIFRDCFKSKINIMKVSRKPRALWQKEKVFV